MAEDTEAKHGGNNGKKEGLSGSSFFTWFMVIALLGVWTSVAVVWFDLVDYEDVLAKAKDFRYNLSEVLQGKLEAYDTDGDGDFDIEDAKVLLGLKEREVAKQESEDSEGDSQATSEYINDNDLEDILNDEPESDSPYDDVNDLEEALDDHETAQAKDDVVSNFDLEDALEPSDPEPDVVSDFNLEDAVEPSVHKSLNAEPEAEDEPEEAKQVTEEKEDSKEEEAETEGQVLVEDNEPEGEDTDQDAAAPEDNVEDLPLTQDDQPEVEEQGSDEEEDGAEPVVEESEEIVETTESEEIILEEEAIAVEAEIEPLAAEKIDEIPETLDENINENAEVEEAPDTEPESPEEYEGNQDELEVPNSQQEESQEENVFSEEVETVVEEEVIEEEVVEEPAVEEEVAEEPAVEEEVAEEPAVEEEVAEEPAVEEEVAEEPAVEEEVAEEPVVDEEVAEEPVVEEEVVEELPEENVLFKENEPTQTEVDESADYQAVPEGEVVPEETEDTATEVPEETLHEEQVPEESTEDDDRPSNEQAGEQNPVTSDEPHEDHAGNESFSQKNEKAKKKKPKLLNKFDKTIKTELNAAEKLRKKGKVEEALKAFEALVATYPQSPRAKYGKAQCEDDLAEKLRSNDVLLRAISSYEEVSTLPNVPEDLLKLALKRRANRQQFLGRMRGSVLTLHKLVQLFPDDILLKNDLGVGYLLLGDNKKAKEVYEEVLSQDPSNGFAKVHYGFILKADNKIAESIPYLREGLLSGEPGTDDGRFYFHLGDALQRVGDKEAYTWYEVGYKKGHFASIWQRSLYNVKGLKAQPWWTAKETGFTDLVRTLEVNWKIIRDEGLAVMDEAKGLFIPEDENLREKGDWSQYTLWQQGRKNEKSCKAAPRTCALLERFPESTGCRRGQIKYSVMHPGTHVWPHTGPTNCRLRMHLGLVIPKPGCRIRCANDTRSWEEGRVLIFDDSFEHEVWQDADSYRLIFIVDVWHPELTQHQRKTLPAI
ncbi:aspartyl/asparaginyl beta-hydroxylase isoform X3 [Pyxicephalus adspersus]|uniref:aspartyl/asparaginyl beta-hydroxylase isoform X3 n=1 Tax=Pyxicephalus adspersus TaxID=30357 RepID=UPI003B5C8261